MHTSEIRTQLTLINYVTMKTRLKLYMPYVGKLRLLYLLALD